MPIAMIDYFAAIRDCNVIVAFKVRYQCYILKYYEVKNIKYILKVLPPRF